MNAKELKKDLNYALLLGRSWRSAFAILRNAYKYRTYWHNKTARELTKAIGEKVSVEDEAEGNVDTMLRQHQKIRNLKKEQDKLYAKVAFLRKALFDADEVLGSCVVAYLESDVRKDINSAIDLSEPHASLAILADYKTQEPPRLEDVIDYWNSLQRTLRDIDAMCIRIDIAREKNGLPPLPKSDTITIECDTSQTTTDWIPACASESIARFLRAMCGSPRKKYENFFDMAKRVGKPKRAKDKK